MQYSSLPQKKEIRIDDTDHAHRFISFLDGQATRQHPVNISPEDTIVIAHLRYLHHGYHRIGLRIF